MNKYDLIIVSDITNTVFACFIVVLAVLYNNYFLLFLLFICGTPQWMKDL